MGRTCSKHGDKRSAYKILVGNPEGKRPLGRSRHTWGDNINRHLKEIVIWTGFIWLRIGTGGGLL
jgi:hypothetical protein